MYIIFSPRKPMTPLAHHKTKPHNCVQREINHHSQFRVRLIEYSFESPRDKCDVTGHVCG